MHRFRWMLLLILTISFTQAVAVPVYRIGMNFQGLDTSEQLRGEYSYTFQDTVSVDVFYPDDDNTPKYKSHSGHDYELRGNFHENPYAVLYDKNGKQIWKRYGLIDFSAIQIPDNFEVPYEEDSKGEYSLEDLYQEGTDGYLLADKKTQQTILKRIDGSEVKLPLKVTDWDNFYEGLSGVRWLFYKGFWDKPTEFTAVDKNGLLLWKRTTNWMLLGQSSPADLGLNEAKDRIIVMGGGLKDQGTVLMSSDGSLFISYPDAFCQDATEWKSVLPGVPDFFVLSKEPSDLSIYDFQNGVKKVDIICDALDMTQIGDKLIAVVAYEHIVAVVDVLSGKLLQDLTPPEAKQKNAKIRISNVKISPDAREVWYSTKDASKKVVVKHFKSAKS